MAKPIRFPEVNFTWKGWEGDDVRDEVGDLPAYREHFGPTISCWGLSWKERFMLLFSGKVWLWVWGNHPPVLVDAGYPFMRKRAEDVEDSAKEKDK